MNKNEKGRTIAVVGPHYSGKSTLCTLFENNLNYQVVKEEWWKDPYRKSRQKDYFKSQIWYLLQGMTSISNAKNLNTNGVNVMMDTFIYSSLIFAETKLSPQDFKLFKSTLLKVAETLPLPDVLIYLHADPKYLFKTRRIQRVKDKTGPKSDKTTPLSWIEEICKLNKKYFSTWTKTKIIKIDVEKIDIKQPKEFDKITKQIQNL